MLHSANGLISLLASKLIRRWIKSLDCRAIYEDRDVDPIYGVGGPRIYVVWHENLLVPLCVRENSRASILLSRHKDADVLARVAQMFGFDCVRGSTFRGGAVALRELADKAKQRHVVITPDGPRGPRRTLAQGPIYLASTLGLPVVAIGVGYDRPWRTPTWDRFAMPRPFCRARAIMSAEMVVPPGLDRDGIESHRLGVEQKLNELSDRAERWAESGRRISGEVVIRPTPAPLPGQREAPALRLVEGRSVA